MTTAARSDTLVIVRDSNLNDVGELDNYTSLKMVPQFNGVGGWEMTAPRASATARKLLADGAGIFVYDVPSGDLIMSGPVGVPGRVVAGTDPDGTPGEDTITTAGPDDNVVLNDFTYPDTTAVVPVYPAASGSYSPAYDTQTSAAETMLRYYVDHNVGPSAPASRRVPGLTLAADLGRGTTVNYSARYYSLPAVLSQIALAGGGLGWKVVATPGAGRQFQVYQPTDRHQSVVFSVPDTVTKIVYSRKRPVATRAVVLGQGDGTARKILEVTLASTASLEARYGRIATIIDARDAATDDLLAERGTTALLEGGEQLSVEVTPNPTGQLVYGRDYRLGDFVTVIVDGVPITELIREVTIEATPTSRVVTPFIGSPGATTAPLGVQHRLSQALRLATIERSK